MSGSGGSFLSTSASAGGTSPMDCSAFTSCYTVTKHSWRGRYTRVFCVGPQGVATCDIRSLNKLTNFWPYSSALRGIVAEGSGNGQFLLTVAGSGSAKVEELRFSCVSDAERAQLLTDVNRYRSGFDPHYLASLPSRCYPAMKYTTDQTQRPCTLRVTAVGVEQLSRLGKGEDDNCGKPSDKPTTATTASHASGLLRDVAGHNTSSQSSNYEKVGEYLFANVRGLTTIADRPGSVVIAHGPEMKLHLYDIANPKSFLEAVIQNTTEYIGLPRYPPMNVLQQSQFDSDRLGIRRDALEAVEEFTVLKHSPKQRDGTVRRMLSTTAVALVERDPVTYNPISAHFLGSIFALVRCEDDDQRFYVLFKDSRVMNSYVSPLRDTILAHVLTACNRAGDGNVCILPRPPLRCRRLSSLVTAVSEEVESLLLKSLVEGRLPGSPDEGKGRRMAGLITSLEFFNSNVPPMGLQWSENKDGLFAENREKLIYSAVEAVLEHFLWVPPPDIRAMTSSANNSTPSQDAHASERYQHFMTGQFEALSRLSVSRVGFSSIALVPSLFNAVGVYSVQALRLGNLALSFSVVEFLNTLMTPFHHHYEKEHESINKNRLLGAEGFIRSLMEVLRDHIPNESASLLVRELLLLFRFALCPPYSATTDPAYFKRILGDLATILGRHLFDLLSHTCAMVRYTAGQLIRVVMEEGDERQLARMQQLALSEAGLLTQFNTAVASPNRPVRDLARRLIAYWAHKNVATQDILRRMVPITLLSFLQSPEEAPPEEQEQEPRKKVIPMTALFKESKTGWFKKSFNPSDVALAGTNGAGREAVNGSPASDGADGGRVRYRVRDVKIAPTINWNMFFYQIKQNHHRPDLIWNHATRSELEAAVKTELAAFRQYSTLQRDNPVAWNYAEFEVVYHSLDAELKIGDHYPRLLFEDAHPVIARPREFFHDLYHRFLLVQDMKSKLECMHGLALLYKHYAEAIGEFRDVPFLLRMLQTTMEPMMRDRLLLLLVQILKARHNIKLFLDHDGLTPLMELVTVAHLHIDRPQLKSVSNTIEFPGSLTEMQGQEKVWHYISKGSKSGPASFAELKDLYGSGELTATSKVWAQGMSGWREFQSVAQLRWGVMCADQPSLLTLSEVTSTVLDVLLLLCEHFPSVNDEGAVMHPQPKVKRLLSSPTSLPHLVQLLLTFDSGICARVHTLLFSLMEANPLVSRFFLTGVFFFSCLYPASDVLPMCRLFAATHRRQAFQYAAASNDLVRDSILAPLFPPAMVCYLTHHGAEAFADVLLGEYDNPEAIWSASMRRYLGAKVAAHVADFTPRLLGNNTVVYQYCPIAGVQYESLEQELFCSQYYLRHFCDELRFPAWPVRDAVRFLADVLHQWTEELSKKPTSLTKEMCYDILKLHPTELDIEAEGPAKSGCDTATYSTSWPPSKQDVRKAYYHLAAQYHPDKNPNGRDLFEQIQRAYELLTADRVPSTDPSPSNIALLLKAQSILFRRSASTLREYKYAGYGLLLRLIENEFRSPNALQKEIVLLDPATELCYFTIRNAPLNADELQEENGIRLLAEIATYCFDFITPNSRDEETHVRIAKNCMLTFSISARFTECRLRMLREGKIPYLTAKGMAYHNTPELARACTEACASEARSEKMQSELIHYGSIWHLISVLFSYDPSLQKAGVGLDEAHHKQLFANRAAVFALRAICVLAGITRPRAPPADTDGTTTAAKDSDAANTAPLAPDVGLEGAAEGDYGNADVTTCHKGVHELLKRLLTPFIVHKMENLQVGEEEVLTLLNSNCDTPYFLWGNSCRAELGELAQTNSDRFREVIWGATDVPSLTESVTEFAYTLHAKEAVVGGVFLRLFLAQPSYAIENPDEFFMALLQFLRHDRKAPTRRRPEEARTEQSTVTADAPLLAARSLRVLSCNYGRELSALASKQLPAILDLLTLPPLPAQKVFEVSVNKADEQEKIKAPHISVVVEVVQALTQLISLDVCLDAMAALDTAVTTVTLLLEHLLECLESSQGVPAQFDDHVETLLALVQQMLAHRTLIQQTLDRGLYVHLLFLYAMTARESVREQCCRCLGAACSDRLVGPPLFLRASLFLPAAFLEMMKDNVKQACRMLDVWQENPELLWTRSHRDRLVRMLREGRRDIATALRADPLACWKPQETSSAGSSFPVEGTSENHPTDHPLSQLQVGGVYVALYVQQPGWAVRHPKDFLLALLEYFEQQASKACVGLETTSPAAAASVIELLDLLTKAGETLLRHSPNLRDYMASLGYGSKLVRLLASSQEGVVRCGLRWLVEFSRSAACIESTTCSIDVIPSLIGVVETHAALTMDVLETLEGFLSNATRRSRLLEYAVRDRLPETLLAYLEEGLPDSASAEAGVSAATVRAALVKVLKALLTVPDDANTPQIQALLEKSAVWGKYKHQSHDMFLTQTQFGGFLMGRNSRASPTATSLSLAAPVGPGAVLHGEPPPFEESSIRSSPT